MVHSDMESSVEDVFAEELQSCAEELQIPPSNAITIIFNHFFTSHVCANNISTF